MQRPVTKEVLDIIRNSQLARTKLLRKRRVDERRREAERKREDREIAELEIKLADKQRKNKLQALKQQLQEAEDEEKQAAENERRRRAPPEPEPERERRRRRPEPSEEKYEDQELVLSNRVSRRVGLMNDVAIDVNEFALIPSRIQEMGLAAKRELDKTQGLVRSSSSSSPITTNRSRLISCW